MLYLPRNVAALAGAASKDSSRYAMQGVRVTDTQDGNYRLDATDGRILAVVRGPCLEAPGANFVNPANVPEGQSVFVVPRENWIDAFKLVGDAPGWPKGQLPLAVAAGDNTITLAGVKGMTTAQIPEGRYPDVNSVLPKAPPVARFRVNPKLLMELLKIACAVGDPEGPAVEVCFFKGSTVVGLTGRNSAGQYFDGLIVPLTTK